MAKVNLLVNAGSVYFPPRRLMIARESLCQTLRKFSYESHADGVQDVRRWELRILCSSTSFSPRSLSLSLNGRIYIKLPRGGCNPGYMVVGARRCSGRGPQASLLCLANLPISSRLAIGERANVTHTVYTRQFSIIMHLTTLTGARTNLNVCSHTYTTHTGARRTFGSLGPTRRRWGTAEALAYFYNDLAHV